MKITYKWLWFLTLVALSFAYTATAQTNDVPVPGTPAPLPTDVSGYWELAITGITPLLVTGLRWLAPKIPSLVLPLITPLVGIGLGLLMNKLGAAHLSWVDMAKAGALAVFLREAVNQAITKRLMDTSSTTPPAK